MSERAFWSGSALLFAAATTVTVVWCASMSAMGMPMPGGWTMSMAWMRMAGQTWPAAAASFLGMWVVMMVAMMLPSVAPVLSRYRTSAGRTALAGLGYFAVWTVVGAAAFPLGVVLAAIEMKFPAVSRAVPVAAGAVVALAGGVQLTRWKAHHLACCKEGPPLEGAAFRHGLRLGLHCNLCCAGLTGVLLAVGVMDLRAMALVGAAITAERLAPSGPRMARAIGVVVVAAGVVLIARAV
jgi:predicted metal-binding membrane protein